MSFTLRAAVAATTIMSTAGCNVISSKPMTDDTGTGLVYALPKGQVTITATRKAVTGEDVAAARTAAKAAADKAAATESELAAAKARLDRSKGALANVAPAGKDRLTRTVAIDEATVSFLTSRVATEKAAAAAAKMRAEQLAQIEGTLEETVSIGAPEIVPDPAARYIANLEHSALRDDNLKITIANGMLSSGDVTSADQTKNVLVSLAQAAAAVMTMGAGALPPGAAGVPYSLRPKPAQPETCRPYSFTAVFDPADMAATADVSARLERKRPTFALEFAGARPRATGRAASDAGLVYRVQRPVTIHVVPKDAPPPECGDRTEAKAQSFNFVVPDSSTAYVLPSKAGAFTTTKHVYAFKDGMPTDFSVEEPSEALAIASTPIEIIRALVSVPTEFLQLRVNYDTQANALLDAKVAELEARLAILQAQRGLDAARAAAADAPAAAAEP